MPVDPLAKFISRMSPSPSPSLSPLRYLRPIVQRTYNSSWQLFDGHLYNGGMYVGRYSGFRLD